MEQKIRVGAVSYLNTKPMITGLEKWNDIELSLDYPSKIAEAIITNKIDIGLVPVAVIPKLSECQFVSNFGIGCTGKVLTVALFSNVTITDVATIYLDYQSRTSVALVQLLCKEYWKINPTFKAALPGYEKNISNNDAAVIIGDRAFDQLSAFTHIYDLGEAWFDFTQLPFVFARWVATKPLTKDFVQEFEDRIKENIQLYTASPEYNLLSEIKQNYVTNIINYNLSPAHIKGQELFLEKLGNM